MKGCEHLEGAWCCYCAQQINRTNQGLAKALLEERKLHEVHAALLSLASIGWAVYFGRIAEGYRDSIKRDVTRALGWP